MLNRILNDPDSMAQILSMARSFGMGRESEPPPAPEPTAKDPFFMDGGMLLKMMQLFRVMEHSDPKQDALLCALRAYLAPERQEKLDRAVELARLTRLAGAALGPAEFLAERWDDLCSSGMNSGGGLAPEAVSAEKKRGDTNPCPVWRGGKGSISLSLPPGRTLAESPLLARRGSLCLIEPGNVVGLRLPHRRPLL